MEKKRVELRCANCGRKLGDVEGSCAIVCSRCGGLNDYNSHTGHTQYTSKCMRTRKTSSGMTFD